jgi:hypothetical protein
VYVTRDHSLAFIGAEVIPTPKLNEPLTSEPKAPVYIVGPVIDPVLVQQENAAPNVIGEAGFIHSLIVKVLPNPVYPD